MLSRRFDRAGPIRTPFLSAMAMMGPRTVSAAATRKSSMLLRNMVRKGKTDAHASIDVLSSTC